MKTEQEHQNVHAKMDITRKKRNVKNVTINVSPVHLKKNVLNVLETV
jgi:hypothetical protein